MFAILSKSERTGLRRGRITDVTRRFLPDNDSIYYISASSPDSLRCAGELVFTLGSAANHIVPDGHFDLPDIRGLKIIDTLNFRRAQLLYSVVNAAIHGNIESLGIKCSDPRFSLKCACIAKYVRSVAFSSSDARVTDNFRYRVFSLYGASVADLRDDANYAVVDFDLFSVSLHGMSCSPSAFEYSGFLSDYIPNGVDKCDFLSAVCYYTRFKEHALSESRCLWGTQRMTTAAILNYFT